MEIDPQLTSSTTLEKEEEEEKRKEKKIYCLWFMVLERQFCEDISKKVDCHR